MTKLGNVSNLVTRDEMRQDLYCREKRRRNRKVDAYVCQKVKSKQATFSSQGPSVTSKVFGYFSQYCSSDLSERGLHCCRNQAREHSHSCATVRIFYQSPFVLSVFKVSKLKIKAFVLGYL